MGKKGFTLAELMGVIVLLSVIAIIVVPVVDKNLKKGTKITCKTQEKSIIEAAKNYNSDRLTCENKGQVCKVSIRTLVGDGYLEGSKTTDDTPPINPATGDPYDDKTYIQIENTTGYNYAYNLMYEGKDKGTCKE